MYWLGVGVTGQSGSNEGGFDSGSTYSGGGAPAREVWQLLFWSEGGRQYPGSGLLMKPRKGCFAVQSSALQIKGPHDSSSGPKQGFQVSTDQGTLSTHTTSSLMPADGSSFQDKTVLDESLLIILIAP